MTLWLALLIWLQPSAHARVEATSCTFQFEKRLDSRVDITASGARITVGRDVCTLSIEERRHSIDRVVSTTWSLLPRGCPALFRNRAVQVLAEQNPKTKAVKYVTVTLLDRNYVCKPAK